jgi:hypothetical protein
MKSQSPVSKTYHIKELLLLAIGLMGVIVSSLFVILKALKADDAGDFWGTPKLTHTKPIYKTFMWVARIGIVFRSFIFITIGVQPFISSIICF